MKKRYQKAWDALNKTSPLEADCGALCNQACCRGTTDDGMLLFPGEEEMYSGGGDWFSLRDSNIRLKDGTVIKLFVCTGKCRRDMRPLSCRIFPVMPYIDDFDYLEFVPDLRGAAICPLLYDTRAGQISPVFIDALYTAFEKLIEDEKVLEFIEILSVQRDEMADDFRHLLGKDW